MDKKINVLYLINYAGGGGSEQYLKILVDNMSENINPMLCYNEAGLLVNEFENRNIKTIKLEMRKPFDFKAAKELSNICKENNIDIIHSNYLRENYISVLSKMFYHNKAKIIYTCHFNTYDGKIISLFNKIFYNKLSRIISISNETTKSLIASGSNRNKIELIYHGIKDNDLVSPDNNMKKEFDIDENILVISSASRFSPEKGNEFLIESIKELKHKIIDSQNDKIKNIKFKVLLANTGSTLDKCKELVSSYNLNDEIKFIGFLNDTSKLYLASDIYVTSSKSEGLGLATLESLSFGVPNVVTNIGGLTEIVNEKSNCGLSCDYGDADKFSDALLKLLSDDELRNELKVNAKNTVRENFSLSNMINKTLNVYKNTIEK